MNTLKAVIATGLVAVTVAANAQIVLTGVPSKFNLKGGFLGNPATPTYGASADLTINQVGPLTKPGLINTWWFQASDASGNLPDLSYDITLNGITSKSTLLATLTVMNENANLTTIKPPVFQGQYQGTIDAFTGLSTSTQTLVINAGDIPKLLGIDPAGLAPNQEYQLNVVVSQLTPEPASYATFAFGAAGLLISRRRRRSK